MEREELIELASARIPERRRRVTDVLVERMSHRQGLAVQTGRTETGFYCEEQERDCAADLRKRADYWLQMFKEVLDAARVAIDDSMRLPLYRHPLPRL